MKKQFLTIVTLAFGALVLITNCKKKEEKVQLIKTEFGSFNKF